MPVHIESNETNRITLLANGGKKKATIDNTILYGASLKTVWGPS